MDEFSARIISDLPEFIPSGGRGAPLPRLLRLCVFYLFVLSFVRLISFRLCLLYLSLFALKARLHILKFEFCPIKLGYNNG